MYSYSLLGLTVRYKLDGQVAEPGPEAVYSSQPQADVLQGHGEQEGPSCRPSRIGLF
jgi:hypothetical protein